MAQKETCRYMELNGGPWYKPIQTEPTDYKDVKKKCVGERSVSPSNDAGRFGYPYKEE